MMETIAAILSPILWLAGWLIWLVWSIVSYLFWIALWLLLPLAIVGFIALRIAEKVLGPAVVRGWIKAQSMKFGTGAWVRTRRLTFAFGALPLRVLGWLFVYTLWHSLISLFWQPRWHPWPRAWAKRWKPPPRAAPSVPAARSR